MRAARRSQEPPPHRQVFHGQRPGRVARGCHGPLGAIRPHHRRRRRHRAFGAPPDGALLTLVNTARRTLLGGIEVFGPAGLRQPHPSRAGPIPDQTPCASSAACQFRRIREIGRRADRRRRRSRLRRPVLAADMGGLAGRRDSCPPGQRLAETDAIALSPALAAAACAAEVFAYHAGDHPMAGRRAAGSVAMAPRSRLAHCRSDEPALAYLPSRLWLIGLGNLGQAFAWLLAALPYEDPGQVRACPAGFRPDRAFERQHLASVLHCRHRAQEIAHRRRLAGGPGLRSLSRRTPLWPMDPTGRR